MTHAEKILRPFGYRALQYDMVYTSHDVTFFRDDIPTTHPKWDLQEMFAYGWMHYSVRNTLSGFPFCWRPDTWSPLSCAEIIKRVGRGGDVLRQTMEELKISIREFQLEHNVIENDWKYDLEVGCSESDSVCEVLNQNK